MYYFCRIAFFTINFFNNLTTLNYYKESLLSDMERLFHLNQFIKNFLEKYQPFLVFLVE